jgi:simple sugar transport system ATP-binding protein
MMANGVTAVACDDITVTYGDVFALRNVSVGFEPGRIHAVVGQNGAGKTTFARVCAGIVRPSSGRLVIAGRAVPIGDVSAARLSGVELVHQSFALPPSFTVAEAMEFGSTRRTGPVYSWRALERRWRDHLAGLDVAARPGDRIRDLPVETQQGVEIARALVSEARVLILDEPTAVLAPPAIERLFARIRRLRSNGVTVLVILHKIHEVLGIAETVTVLRGGRLVADRLATAQLGARDLADAIVGSASLTPIAPAVSVRAPRGDRAPALELRGAATRPGGDGPALDAFDLTVGHGEIVGIAGVEGNGQRTLVNAIAGLCAMPAGRLSCGGHDLTRAPLLDRRGHGLRIVPFERNVEGLSLSSALWQNWAARLLVVGRQLRLVDPQRLRAQSRAALERWSVRFASVDQSAGSLSGGNAQKTIFAREIDDAASIIVAAQPTRGLDIEAMAFVWSALRAARDRGCGVLLISSDLDELFDISDRIVVVLSGRVVGEFRPPYDLGEIGAAMTGAPTTAPVGAA